MRPIFGILQQGHFSPIPYFSSGSGMRPIFGILQQGHGMPYLYFAKRTNLLASDLGVLGFLIRAQAILDWVDHLESEAISTRIAVEETVLLARL